MKCLGRLDSMVLAAVLLCSACTGGASSGGGGDKNPPPDDEMPPPSEGSLERNPSQPLSCDRQITENPATSPLSRLTDKEYLNSVKDLLGSVVADGDLPKLADFPADLTNGAFTSDASIQQVNEDRGALYESSAIAVAGKAVNNLPKLMGCDPASGEAKCVETFVSDFGLRAWRRPLTDAERDSLKKLFADARAAELDLKTSVQAVVAALLVSPQFLYRFEEGTGQETESKGKQLSDYEMASRLSYLVWDSMPDSTLFEAAKGGKLTDVKDIEAQAQRLLEDPRARPAIAQFYREWLHIERLEARLPPDKKDPKVYPKYGGPQATAMSASLDRFLEDAFWEGDHSLKHLLTSTRGFVNSDLAEIFGVDAGGADLVAKDLPSDQRHGLLTQPAFMAGWAHATEQAPILRGTFVMESLLCAPSPQPDASLNIELKPVPDRNAITYRQFVANSTEQGLCKSCHQTINGFGFLFENYDGIGAYQTKERNLDIDASNTVTGTYDLDGEYKNGVEFSKKLATSEQAAQCLVQKFYEHALARGSVPEDGCAIAPLTDGFLADGTDFHSLVKNLVRSSAFRFRTTAK